MSGSTPIPNAPHGPSFWSRILRPNRWRLWAQFALLGAFVLVIPILLTSSQLLDSARQVLIDHEVIDLADESNLRVNDFREDVAYLAREVRALSARPGMTTEQVLAELSLNQAPKELDNPASVSIARRKHLYGTAIGVYRFPKGNPATALPAAKLESPARSEALLRVLEDLDSRLRRPPPAPDRSGLHFLPAEGRTPAGCLLAVGTLAPDGQILAVVIDFAKYVANRQAISPRHFYLVADKAGQLLIRPQQIDIADRSDVRDVAPWQFPTENGIGCFDPISLEQARRRLARMVLNGGARLPHDNLPMPTLAYRYRKGYFGTELDLSKTLGSANRAKAASADLNRQLRERMQADPKLRCGEVSAQFGYVELSHPDPKRLAEVSAVVDTWWKQLHGQSVRWTEPLECKTFQGQLVPMRLDLNDEDEPGWLIVAASVEELREDIDDRFNRVHTRWVLPTLAVTLLLGAGLVVTLTHSLNRLARAARKLRDGEQVRLPLGGSREVAQLAQTLQEMVRRVQERDRELFERAERIRRMNEDLETRVRVRTAELEEANGKLEIAVRDAQAAVRAKDSFVANMSHELRQPLHIIIGFTEALKEEATDTGNEAAVPDLDKILTAAKHLLDLINDILDMAKISAGKMELSVTTFAVPKLVANVATLVGPLADANSNRFEVNAAPELGTMSADERRVKQILLNLLSNAFKFTKGGVVRFGVERINENERDWIRFRVTDTGKGMTPEQVGRLFQRFYQADSSTTRGASGTGLGLAITQSFNELLGGQPIRVISTEGIGSEFVVTLPAEVPTAPLAPPPPQTTFTPPEGTESAEGRTVLVIDDDPTVRELMRRFLSREGFAVVEVGTGDEGFAIARQVRPCVVTLDVMMPGSDGWSVLARLKADPITAEIPVVMLTIVDDRGRGYSLGAADYLTKPIDWNRLGAILRKYLSAGRGDTVLVVDDDPNNREVVRRYLEREGWKIDEAADGEEALHRFAERPPALILLDLMMPVLDGFGFLDELGKRFPGHRVPVIVLTAKELTPEDFDRLNGRVNRILQKGDLASLENLMGVIRRSAKPGIA